MPNTPATKNSRTSTDIVRLVAAQKKQAIEVLTAAFADDPMYTHIFPDRPERMRSLGRLWDGVLSYGLVYGEIYTTPAVKGVACWLPPGRTTLTTWRMLRTGLGLARAIIRFGPEARRRVRDLIAYTEERHQRLVSGPHWYLWVLGVEPSSQGQGLGTKLIQPGLARADEMSRLCYLETETESNVAFYQHRGFIVIDEGEVPGYGLKIWTMLRLPRR
jgi:GNAT superfamily N-acetyltransferase